MKTLLPAIAIAIAAAGTVYAMSKDAPSADEATQVRLPVAAVSAPEITPWILAAARELGHSQVRAYDGSVFISVGDDNISFFKEGFRIDHHAIAEHADFARMNDPRRK